MTSERHDPSHTTDEPLRVLLVDNDEDVTELVTAILGDEGYAVTALNHVDPNSIAAAVGQIEPDCILLDSGEGPEFGGSWAQAASLASRARPVPTVMFTAHSASVREAQTGTSDRARAAGFASIVGKPFALDDLLDAVASAAGRSTRFDRSEAADRERTRALVDELQSAGATDIRISERREWATFVSPQDERIYQLYWWQRLGVYILGRYDDDARLERSGQFFERRAAITAALDRDEAGLIV